MGKHLLPVHFLALDSYWNEFVSSEAVAPGPADIDVLYREAVVFALAGRQREALRTLAEALRRGYSLSEAQKVKVQDVNSGNNRGTIVLDMDPAKAISGHIFKYNIRVGKVVAVDPEIEIA